MSNPLRHSADYSSAVEGMVREVGSFCRCKHPSLVRSVRQERASQATPNLNGRQNFLCYILLSTEKKKTNSTTTTTAPSCRYYGVVAHKPDRNFWLVTEYVTGHSLAKYLVQPELKALYKVLLQ